MPRRSVRLRLTLLYGTLFLVSGAALLTITYVLVSLNTGDLLAYDGSHGVNGLVAGPGHRPTPGSQWGMVVHSDGRNPPKALPPEQVATLARAQHSAEMSSLLTRSGIALGIMTVISLALGWVVAGRILRPLRTITAAAREISATNLHRRLALDGPDDELKELGDTFDELLGRLEASFEAQRRFVANASHELRSPLARQRTLGQVALADPDATVESLRAAHERVLAAGVQQEKLIEALLTLAKGQAGIEAKGTFDLAQLAGQVLETRRADAAYLGLELTSAIEPAPAVGDPRLAERLITNLVDNALRHNVAHGLVEVATGTRDGRPFISVVNTGPLIPAAAIDRIFQPFKRLGTDRTGHGEGHGLGLSIVQAVAAAHGATISARPKPEGGLAIEVTFPSPDLSSFPQKVGSVAVSEARTP